MAHGTDRNGVQVRKHDYVAEVGAPFDVGLVLAVSVDGQVQVYYGPSVYKRAGMKIEEEFETTEGEMWYDAYDLIVAWPDVSRGIWET